MAAQSSGTPLWMTFLSLNTALTCTLLNLLMVSKPSLLNAFPLAENNVHSVISIRVHIHLWTSLAQMTLQRAGELLLLARDPGLLFVACSAGLSPPPLKRLLLFLIGHVCVAFRRIRLHLLLMHYSTADKLVIPCYQSQTSLNLLNDFC